MPEWYYEYDLDGLKVMVNKAMIPQLQLAEAIMERFNRE